MAFVYQYIKFKAKMKRNLFITSLLVTTFLVSCDKKEETNDIIIEKKELAPVKKNMQSMESMDYSQDINWVGSTYKIYIHRESDGNLNKVKDESGTVYLDNKINIKVCRNDGSEFFNRTFTKNDFKSCLDQKRRNNGALLGLMFSTVEGNDLVFEGSVGSPDPMSDEFIPIVMKLNKMGSVNIERSTTLDAGGIMPDDEDGV
ncbi:MAG: DUF4738 domain-containing protein [Prevotella sp.]|nr:DUF4738 domain-containing protein [Prevotella sp.]